MNTIPVPAGIPGVTMCGLGGFEPPNVLVISPEKAGKSSLAVSLLGWPDPMGMPVVLAFDPSGPDSCAALGYPVPVLKVKDMPGSNAWEKTSAALARLESYFAKKPDTKQPYFSSIVVDCASRMAEVFFGESLRLHKSKDKRQNYGHLLEQSRETYNRLTVLGVPTFWLAWQRDAHVEENIVDGKRFTKQTMGGPQIAGQFKSFLAGSCHQICILEKRKVSPETPGISSDGFLRVFHTKNWRLIEAGGRYRLPEPMPAHLGMLVDSIMRRPPHFNTVEEIEAYVARYFGQIDPNE
jgi:hypothetical protein